MSFCVKCGTEINDGVKFCPNCGNVVGEVAPIKEADKADELKDNSKSKGKKEKKKKKIFPIIVIAVVAIGLIALIGGKGEAPEEPITYTDYNQGGIIFSIPSTYVLSESTEKCLTFDATDNNSRIFIKIDGSSVTEDVFNSNIEKIDQGIDKTIGEMNTSYERETARSITVDNMPAREFTYKAVVDNTEVALVGALIDNTKGDTGVVVLAFCVPSAKDKLIATYTDIISKAKFDGVVVEKKEETKAEVSSEGSATDIKEFLDAYETFIDEYVEFMKKYMDDPTNVVSMLEEYTDIMKKYEEFAEAVDSYDSESMTPEEAAYYLEVTTRCNQKMLEIYK